MKKLRVLALMHEDLVPPESLEGHSDKEIAEWKVEFDVVDGLQQLGHEVRPLGVTDELGPIRRAVLGWKPHVVFNLLEEFHGVGVYDQHVVGYLELLKQPYTGCNPRGLMLTHDKPLMKKILSYHRIPTPRFGTIPLGRKFRGTPRRLEYPLLIKSTIEDASLGISQASIVHSDDKLSERIAFVHEKVQSDALVEEFIEGRELYVGVLGNQRLQTFPIWEMEFTKMPDDVARIATAKVKWDPKYQEKHGIITRAAQGLSEAVQARIVKICKRAYRDLSLSGYARMDLRLTDDERIYLIEANANPNLEFGEDFAESAEAVGIAYPDLLQRILNLGLRYRAAWRA
ncbi:MAG: ATP-grasp domain-containing protein [Planctomycetota bacterium]|nr:MAG: ATP-grasp domain-containing protein [Planctomycetota bacterium]REJ87439.1 MAG: ATP-grasp domain-containing protein [Planctomycetota bacterium]REK30769.1 MAG: ATP-grasp domain-containing protein [Planctomycetota bacterium]REK42149.1 MAG: ATP-grasp domain-containing protein [Planctomycetota bacterium]